MLTSWKKRKTNKQTNKQQNQSAVKRLYSPTLKLRTSTREKKKVVHKQDKNATKQKKQTLGILLTTTRETTICARRSTGRWQASECRLESSKLFVPLLALQYETMSQPRLSKVVF
jgi:hypothetical protein